VLSYASAPPEGLTTASLCLAAIAGALSCLGTLPLVGAAHATHFADDKNLRFVVIATHVNYGPTRLYALDRTNFDQGFWELRFPGAIFQVVPSPTRRFLWVELEDGNGYLVSLDGRLLFESPRGSSFAWAPDDAYAVVESPLVTATHPTLVDLERGTLTMLASRSGLPVGFRSQLGWWAGDYHWEWSDLSGAAVDGPLAGVTLYPLFGSSFWASDETLHVRTAEGLAPVARMPASWLGAESAPQPLAASTDRVLYRDRIGKTLVVRDVDAALLGSLALAPVVESDLVVYPCAPTRGIFQIQGQGVTAFELDGTSFTTRPLASGPARISDRGDSCAFVIAPAQGHPRLVDLASGEDLDYDPGDRVLKWAEYPARVPLYP
jgi:hypothetical protein